jgi:acetyl esterase/lipase
MRRLLPLAALLASILPAVSLGDDSPAVDHKVDVIYGRKFGTALTMDVFTPKKANGAAVVFLVSGGYFSSHEAINQAFFQPLLDRGYTVFAVVHGSQPKFTILEIVADVNRAVRFIRHHAKDYAIDPDRIGVTGASAGGHLSLMLGTAGDAGNPSAKDPVDRESSRVRAVACFFPPTDFLNWGGPGQERLHPKDFDRPFRPAFVLLELDPASNLLVSVVDDAKLRELVLKVSPVAQVSPDDAPALIYHGDADKLVPLQQSEEIVEKLKAAGVDAKLVVKPGSGHGWPGMLQDISAFADWFDEHMKSAK